MMSSLGVCEIGGGGLETVCASRWDGLMRCEGGGVVEREKSRVQRVMNSLDCLHYSHSIGTPHQGCLAPRRGGRSRDVGDGVVEMEMSRVQRVCHSLDHA